MRFAIDTGGTFTDLIVEDDDGECRMFQARTTPADPIAGVLDALTVAAEGYGIDRHALLSRGTVLVHGTTHAINAIITGRTARTALITTQGHGGFCCKLFDNGYGGMRAVPLVGIASCSRAVTSISQ